MKGQQEGSRRGVIFDLDGTLLDTLADITWALNQVLLRRGRPALPQARVRDLVGEGLPRLLELASSVNQAETVRELVEEYRPEYAACMYERTKLYPGIAEMLDRLAAAGMPMSVLSNKTHEFTEPLCRHYLGRWAFAGFRGHVLGGARKPDPAVALELASAMRRPPGEVLFVGDSSVDIETGRNAGMVPIAVTWGYRDKEHLLASKPEVVVDSPGELAKVLLS